jgi:hypothetical protein
VSSKELQEMKQDIKENKNEWLNNLKAFDDQNIYFDEIW